jgi:hypothetical protein
LISAVSTQALDHLAAGVIVTNSCAGVIQINRAAESIVRLEDGLLIRNGQLCAGRVFETARVAKLIAGATAEDNSGAAAARMLVGRSDVSTPERRCTGGPE